MVKRLKKLRALWKLTASEPNAPIPEKVGRAVVLPDMTHEEMLQHERDNVDGWAKFNKRLREILK